MVVTIAFVVFVRCSCVAERFWVSFGFGDLVFCHFSSCTGCLYDPVGVLFEVFLEFAPFSAFSRIFSPSLQGVLLSYSLPRFGGVGHIEVGCVDDGWVGGVACVSFWWLREPGWSKSSSAREVEGGVVFVGVTNFGWWLGGFCGKVVAIIVHLVQECRDVGCFVVGEMVVLFGSFRAWARSL